ncbi:tRNA pseudouridine(55) synthase TruB [Steroidobacter sp. S1-65]|uniref:tRNA pseudouridine synthase B n=1 Tax=Steroidobacter gossypii TaxID=2805490 RepID=A0ABS1WWD5_9GAMM|nr:tRNA pseudouridine(55) synthase TruB [Steroidobacter gossypii]MBM0105289.1 tRNA pseudouridine(55) synthase TruB [Steroidobacter gossypii]
MKRFYREVDGILLLDKALGVSSNAALQQVRVLYGALKAGHAGSLDPLASGLLPVCFGQATKVCGRLLNSGKTYRVLVQLGELTPSGDGETEVVERAPVPPLTVAGVDAVLAGFLGNQQQIPPMHSALKFEGKRLYELARKGESVERPPRDIVIHRIARVSNEETLAANQLEFDVYCSKGTYIRTLAADIAVKLGTLGYVKGLRRLSVDPFGDLPMFTLDALTGESQEQLDGRLLGVDTAFADLPRMDLDASAVKALLLGQTIAAETPAPAAEVRLYGGPGRFLGLGEGLPGGRIKPSRLFITVPEGTGRSRRGRG